MEVKQAWVKKLREVIQEMSFSTTPLLSLQKSPAKMKGHRSSREMDESLIQDEAADRGSLASFSSGSDSDKVSQIGINGL